MRPPYATIVLVTALAAAVGSYGRWWTIPDRHNPWAPLSLGEPPGWLTRHKLARLDESPEACRAFVAGAGFEFTPQPPRVERDGCGWSDALRLRRGASVALAPTVLSCRAAASLALWERHVLQPAAQAHLGSRVARIEHYGSYACRRVYGRESGSLSRHARADALDLAGVVLADGRRVRVAADWGRTPVTAPAGRSGPASGALGSAERSVAASATAASAPSPESAFLHALHAGACGVFDTVLGPDYNAAHADHLHLDRGPYRICR